VAWYEKAQQLEGSTHHKQPACAQCFTWPPLAPTPRQGLAGVVVEEASAFKDMDVRQSVTDSDHYNVCRPRGPRDMRYMVLKTFLEDRWPATQVGVFELTQPPP
jgi:hypothetical protein